MECVDILKSKGIYPAKKYLFENNFKVVESTYVDRKNKHIICLSNMYGCPVRCAFCKSGESYLGNLKMDEINYMGNYIANDSINDQRRILFSFMGSGEPLLNSRNVIKSIKNLSKNNNSSFSLSLSGVNINNLDEFMEDFDINIIKPKMQFSLHSPFDKQRKELIPHTDNLGDILNKLIEYHFLIEKDIDLNYILLNNVNDSLIHAEFLADIVNLTNFKLKINEYHSVNPFFKESKNKDFFIECLNKNNVFPEVYSTDGIDIGAGCGQLFSKLNKNP